MNVVLDTNVLVAIDALQHPDHDAACEAIAELTERQLEIRTVPQVLYEYWVVVTRPREANGLGLSVVNAARLVTQLVELFPPFRDERGVLQRWQQLVVHTT